MLNRTGGPGEQEICNAPPTVLERQQHHENFEEEQQRLTFKAAAWWLTVDVYVALFCIA